MRDILSEGETGQGIVFPQDADDRLAAPVLGDEGSGLGGCAVWMGCSSLADVGIEFLSRSTDVGEGIAATVWCTGGVTASAFANSFWK